MRGAKDPSFLASSKCTQTIANQRKQGHNEVTRNPSQLVLISTIRYKIASLSQRAMLTSQAFRDYFPSFLSLSLKVAGVLFKRLALQFLPLWLCNRPELLAQPPTTQMVACWETTHLHQHQHQQCLSPLPVHAADWLDY